MHIECCHVGVSKQRNGSHVGVPGQLILWELSSILMLTFSFVLVEKHAHRVLFKSA